MTTETALNHQTRFIATLKSIYSAAECYGSPHETIIAEMKRRIYETPEWKRCPRHVREYVYGYNSCLLDSLYYPAKLITWAHIWEGKAYFDWDQAPEECKQAMRENRGDSAHVWTKHLPAIKRFSTQRPIA